MDYFFGFDNYLSQNFDWFFNFNHFMLIVMVAAFIVGCYFMLSAKSEKGKKITKLVLAGVLFILEIGRIIYKYLLHVHNGGDASNFNWWWNISFQMCAIMTWTTIVTLILSAFLKKENKFLQLLYNILFGCALVGGFLTFMYPDCISNNYPILHFINIQTIITHSLLIFVPIYLIKTKDFKVEIKNFWIVYVGYVFIGSVALSASLISGNNFAYSLNLDLVDLGVSFPWHLPIIMIVTSAIALVFYGAFELVYYIKNRRKKKEGEIKLLEEKQKPEKTGLALYITSVVSAVLFGGLITLCTADLIGVPSTWLGILCLLGLIYMILMLVFAEHIKNYMNVKFEEKDKVKHIVFIVLTFIFALPVGIVYLIKYLEDFGFLKKNSV